MARYTTDLVLNKPDDFVFFMMNDYLQKNAFQMSDWKGEPAYRAGDAMVEGFKYLKYSYMNGVLHLEAWLKGNFGSEMNLEGFVACMQKKPYKESLEQLFVALQQEIPAGQTIQGQDGVRVIPVQTVDNTKAANMALVMGILSVIFSAIIPLFGFLFGCIGFSRARMGGGSSKAKSASAGKILSLIGMVLAAVIWVLNITTTAMFTIF